jgi:hypothetical protein
VSLQKGLARFLSGLLVVLLPQALKLIGVVMIQQMIDLITVLMLSFAAAAHV